MWQGGAFLLNLKGTPRAFQTTLWARCCDGTVWEVWQSDLVEYIVDGPVFVYRIMAEQVDTSTFDDCVTFSFSEVGFNEDGEADAWHNLDFDDDKQDLHGRHRSVDVPRTGDERGLPMGLLLLGLKFSVVGIVVLVTRWMRARHEARAVSDDKPVQKR